ncbi:hypothetical protein ACS0TY_000006 [Phlomoides rotata]
MVKLASARENRMYGPRVGRNRSEYMNAGVYVLATILVTGGFAAQLSSEPISGLVLLLIGFGIIMIVNVHDLVAHLAGIDFSVALMELDVQLALVEFAVPLLYLIGTLLFFLATLFIFIQADKGYVELKLEGVVLSMLIGGPVLWVGGSIHNSCQIYERGDGHLQILQHAVVIPFLVASWLFLVAAIFNAQDHHHPPGSAHHSLDLMGERMIWLGIVGSVILFIGGLANVVKVFKMQQMINGTGTRLEKLRGGAQERLLQIREAHHMPLMTTNNAAAAAEVERRRRWMMKDDHQLEQDQLPTPYKDALVAANPST